MIPEVVPPSESVVVVGMSHRSASIEIRERLFFADDEVGAIAHALAPFGEAVVLCTCNRTELYLVGRDPDRMRARAIAELCRRFELPERTLVASLYEHDEAAAARHLCRVAAGLDSAILGEPQVLGQVRRAYELAQSAGATGSLLQRLFVHAVRAGKRVRNETALAERPASFGAAATKVASAALRGLRGRRVLIIGAGQICEVAGSAVHARGASIVVAARAKERAVALAARLDGHGVALDELDRELARADAVICGTRSPRILIGANTVARALQQRTGRPLVLIDLALPRDVDPAAAELSGCALYDLDDLASVAGARSPAAGLEVVHAESIVASEVARFSDWRRSRDVVPTIVSFRRHGEAIRTQELARAQARLAGLSPEQRRAVDTITRQMLNKLLHTPTVRMKEAAEQPPTALYSAVIRHLFALEEAA